jgi:phage repressor protein C with HTH and peptisase S24 domain
MYKNDGYSDSSETFESNQQSTRFGAIDPRSTLKDLIRQNSTTYAAVSKLLGRNSAYIQQFIKRGSPKKLDELDRVKLAEYFSVTGDVLGGPVTETKATFPTVVLPVIDLLHVSESSRQGDTISGFDTMLLDKRWLNSMTFVRPSQLLILLAFGDYMHPTISSGDILLVDRSERSPSRDGIYVIRHSSVYSINRIAMSSSVDSIDVISDNAAHQNLLGLRPSEIDVWGRVLYVGRKLDW